MSPEQKTKTQQPAEKEITPQPKKSNAAIWVLVGCLGIILIVGLVVLAVVAWGGWQIKKRVDTMRPEFEKWQETSEEMRNRADRFGNQMDSVANQMESASGAVPQTLEEPTSPEEKAVGYIRNVYEKSGKKYLDIDYIQWLTGSAAEQAMREDGMCPTKGECIVANDYYIRNQNPRLRTFEIAPGAKIFMQSAGMAETGLPWDKEVTFARLKSVFTSPSEAALRDAPYGIEIKGGSVSKITQYYVP